MTQPDLILKLIEQLLSEREKNIRLQQQLEQQHKQMQNDNKVKTN